MEFEDQNMKALALVVVVGIFWISPTMAATVGDANDDVILLAAAEDRQDRREERGRSDERQDRRDCRQEEGRVGEDKRDCKQDEVRDGVRGNRDDGNDADD